MAGIYIHIPFCKTKCCYCNFYSSASVQQKEHVFKALKKEIEISHDFFSSNDTVSTLYIGGGTPSLFSVSQLEELINCVKNRFNISNFEELTIETNPDDLTDSYIKELAKTECNRLSVGVQSFDNNILKFLKRRHDSVIAKNAIIKCKESGFDNITIDLIYGIPGQNIDILRKDLETAISLSPEHISAYHLTFEKGSLLWKLLEKGEISQIDDDMSEEYFKEVSNFLSNAGYEHYEVSNFAKPNRRAIHNASYWESLPYLGIGPSAHSFDGKNTRRWNFASNLKYISSIQNNNPYFESETLNSVERVNEELMTLLRCKEGVNLEYISNKYGEGYSEKILKNSKQLIESNLLIFKNNSLIIDRENFLKSDYIISSLFL